MEVDVKEQSIKTVSFKEVHAEFEKESQFLLEHKDVSSFRDKGSFLLRSGFEGSIATRLYNELAKGAHVFQRYQDHYHGMYKFIIEPQLERVCEKYNLFVRSPRFFMGDIPEKNVRDMMNFRVRLEDLFDENAMVRVDSGRNGLKPLIEVVAKEMGIYYERHMHGNDFANSDTKVSLEQINELRVKMRSMNVRSFENLIQIAAVEELFNPQAFEESRARIITQAELPPKFQVDTDPIVLCQVNHGYLIVTAWGDESNDELVANQKLN